MLPHTFQNPEADFPLSQFMHPMCDFNHAPVCRWAALHPLALACTLQPAPSIHGHQQPAPGHQYPVPHRRPGTPPAWHAPCAQHPATSGRPPASSTQPGPPKYSASLACILRPTPVRPGTYLATHIQHLALSFQYFVVCLAPILHLAPVPHQPTPLFQRQKLATGRASFHHIQSVYPIIHQHIARAASSRVTCLFR